MTARGDGQGCDLPTKLEASLEFMANNARGVSLIEWGEHARNCLDAARRLRELEGALERIKMIASDRPHAYAMQIIEHVRAALAAAPSSMADGEGADT